MIREKREEDGMNFIEDSGPGSCGDVRNALFGYLHANNVPVPVATKALCQSIDFLRDVDRFNAVVSELGLEVSGVRSDDDLALYWDVSHSGRDVAFIYRGWDDPGFGIGECVPVSADEMPVFMAQANAIITFLATNGLALTTEPMPGGGFWLNMTTAIYSSGFNAGVVGAALGTIAECTGTVRRMVA